MLTMGKPGPKSQGAPFTALAPARQLTNKDAPENLPPATTQYTLNRILGVIEDTKLALTQEIGKVSTELSHICTDHHKLVNGVKDTETTWDKLKPVHQALRFQVTHLSKRIQRLERCTENAEGCCRRNNVRIVGMPEGVKGPDG
ncbi:hypothetical protein NDU88_003955 [Pleurodeles waltl]|uniref:Biogenesis of lysosome-related organelles complex 1 subunit 7 n=1 Tax=Pleurodeles waltl TaxID=8319 RepID=A0AAV7WQI3_PLEWA|nr:hypothetical protein NDU88_003955 [Pleurodeles waltl]